MEYEIWSKKHKMLNRTLRWLLVADVTEQDLHLREGFTMEDYLRLKMYTIVVCSILGLIVLGLLAMKLM